jgi:hypothetical protein
MLKNSFSARLLKKVQMQGGARCDVRGVLSPYVAAPRERANPPQADRWAFFSSLLKRVGTWEDFLCMKTSEEEVKRLRRDERTGRPPGERVIHRGS